MRKVLSFRVLIVLCALLAMAGIGLRTRQIAKQTSQAACTGNLTAILVALHSYHEKYQSFPPAFLRDSGGKPAHSWRVLLLEFIDPDLYRQYSFDESWDGPKNRQLLTKIPGCYHCPNSEKTTKTSYVVVTGKDTVFSPHRTISLGEISRDRHSTILVLETTLERFDWTEHVTWTLTISRMVPSGITG